MPDNGLRSKKPPVVLVVEDAPQFLALVQELLEMLGYCALTAADGPQALAVFEPRQREIDLVLLDVNLPRTKGSALLARLQAIKPAIKIIIISGFLGPEEIENFFRAGVAGVIQKPFRAEQLQAEITRVLGG